MTTPPGQQETEFEILDGVEIIIDAIREQRDPEPLLEELCARVLEIFQCDRAWLLFPCDPDAPAWSVPIERTVPEYPGAHLTETEVPMTPDVAAIFRTALQMDKPVIYGPGEFQLEENTKSFQVQSQMSMAIYPAVGKPWQFGIHQCSRERVWTPQEVRLFRIIGVMTAEALGNLLLHRDIHAANRDLEERVNQRTIELESRKDFLESLVETAQAIVLLLDNNGRILRYNPYLEELSGFRLKEMMGKDWCDTFVPERQRAEIREVLRRAVGGTPTRGKVNPIVTKGGQERVIQWYDKRLKDAQGHPVGLLSVGHDVTEQARIQEELQASVEDKEMLLKELHHRVKNNMQIVSSLLRIQRTQLKGIDDLSVIDAFKETEQRINSMALVHDRLYRSPDAARVDLPSYISQLAHELLKTYRSETVSVSTETSIEAFRISINQAIPCGLIVNELLSNAIKHAFPDNRRGVVQVVFRRVMDEEFELQVSDDGVGLPEGFSMSAASSMGMVIVDSLVRQLGGEISITNKPGASFSIRFRVEDP